MLRQSEFDDVVLRKEGRMGQAQANVFAIFNSSKILQPLQDFGSHSQQQNLLHRVPLPKGHRITCFDNQNSMTWYSAKRVEWVKHKQTSLPSRGESLPSGDKLITRRHPRMQQTASETRF